MALRQADQDDSVVEIDIEIPHLPSEMAECVYDAVCLGRRMRRQGGFYVGNCPFDPNTELALAWRTGYFDTSIAPTRFQVEQCNKVNWKHEGF